MDLEFVLEDMELAAEPFALCELHGRCSLDLPRDPTATLHFVLSGRGEIVVAGQPPIPVSEGDLVLIPALSRHLLRGFGESGRPDPQCRPAAFGLVHLREGNATDGAQLTALCSRVTIGLRRMRNLVDLVRAPIATHADKGSLLLTVVDALLAEIAQPGTGSRAMIRALLRVAMTDVLRRRFDTGDQELGWMRALKDARLWPVLERMLDAPGEPHSVESLASVAGLSRSVFARRFSEAYGAGPMELLRELRIQSAAALLRDTDLPVKQISGMVGFQSRSAFSRAFESSVGSAPQAFRVGSDGR